MKPANKNAILAALGAIVLAAPGRTEPLVQPGAKVALYGDSITENVRGYSKMVETYLTVCEPGLNPQVFQFGWGGETAKMLVDRLDRALAIFQPDLATVFYGMNDGAYREYTLAIGEAYRANLDTAVKKLKKTGTKVLVMGPGVVDPRYFTRLSPEVYNQTLDALSVIARRVASENECPFVDMRTPMMKVMSDAKTALGKDYEFCGPDGVHPGPNGNLVMAHAYLKAMGFDGDLGKITLDFQGESSAADGHSLKSFAGGTAEIESTRYPFCFTDDPKAKAFSAAVLPYVPFNEDLNRLTLEVKNAPSEKLKVTWGKESRVYSKDQLEKGINLAAEFIPNPFNEAFASADLAVHAKKQYEMDWIKNFSRLAPAPNPCPRLVQAKDAFAKATFECWGAFNENAKSKVIPVKHTLKIEKAEP